MEKKGIKAFQLKIAIKNSKPPIWRRVIVPAGITFSQLSIILNEVMGWDGYHLFEFEFYHLELRIIEGADEYEFGYGYYDFLEASETFIREYLEENDWFTYTYDLGDDWQHRVTVEKIIEDYEYNYPQVLKYKGDCPLEDCGGIWGYYDCLEIISDEKNTEYEDRLEWMQGQGYPSEYDMNAVNDKLKEEFFYKFGKADKRCQHEIYQDIFSGKYGLNATKRDKNKDSFDTISEKHKLEQSMQQFADAFNQLEGVLEWKAKLANQYFGKTVLEEIFNDFDKQSILEIAKEKGLKGLSNLNKEKLINKLVKHMISLPVIYEYFLCLSDDEIAEFEKACEMDGLYSASHIAYLERLYDAAYIGMITEGQYMVPEQVKDAYALIKGKEFDEKRKVVSFLRYCINTAIRLYGIVPYDILEQVFLNNTNYDISKEEMRGLIAGIPNDMREWIAKEDKIYDKYLYPDDRGLLEAQGNKSYYIPTRKEILNYGTYGVDVDNKYAKKLEQVLNNKTDAMPDEASYVTRIMQMKITGGYDVQELFKILEDLEIDINSKGDINLLIQCVSDLWNHTRMVENRGFTPAEMEKEERKQLYPLANDSNVINFSTERKKKIYPNDPCPCGSGKKYKNCCKNKTD